MSMSCVTYLTSEQANFLENLRHHLIDLSRRLEQDSSDDVTDYVLFRLQQVVYVVYSICSSSICSTDSQFASLNYTVGCDLPSLPFFSKTMVIPTLTSKYNFG